MVQEFYGGYRGKLLDRRAGSVSQIILIIGYNGCEIVELKIVNTLRGEKSNRIQALSREYARNWWVGSSWEAALKGKGKLAVL